MELRMVWMRKLMILILMLLIPGIAHARPDVRTMTCAQARGLVLQYGAVVMTTGRHTYERYVASQGYCYRPDVIQRAWIATGDTSRCQIGFTCEQRLFRRFFDRND